MIAQIRDRLGRRQSRQLEFEFSSRGGLIERLSVFLARRRADAMLRKVLRPPRPDSAARLSPHLLKDIGLPPDFRM